jgi:hypothetical protein
LPSFRGDEPSLRPVSAQLSWAKSAGGLEMRECYMAWKLIWFLNHPLSPLVYHHFPGEKKIQMGLSENRISQDPMGCYNVPY